MAREVTQQQIETRRRQALTVINTHRTLEDAAFWRDHVDYETFTRLLTTMQEIDQTL